MFPAYEYPGRSHSSIDQELAGNPRLQQRDCAALIEMMHSLNLTSPTPVTEALRTNVSGGKTLAQMLSEPAATVALDGCMQAWREAGCQVKAGKEP